MHRLLHYLRDLTSGRVILWCYAIWYTVNVIGHFDSRPRIWLTSLGLSGIIGAALIISTRPAGGQKNRMDPWVTFRLFLMPFCVSSFAALVKDAGYVLIFPPSWRENLIGLTAIVIFLALVYTVKQTQAQAAKGSP
ncbi:hypothetical protein [Prosthecobacter dejongeii]|uniref:Uncharacterized protein n=1 Tax=Prosthecobacter dejongeii TaxID=48465 RepID=A0A7W7YKX9_9BACT|nr:hypothetical protein [Prosthecobacter dejongeii]MBB5038138.1 hypothetical protein [Prosthecobacter dejongeii]